jgi:hypothetical protein
MYNFLMLLYHLIIAGNVVITIQASPSPMKIKFISKYNKKEDTIVPSLTKYTKRMNDIHRYDGLAMFLCLLLHFNTYAYKRCFRKI